MPVGPAHAWGVAPGSGVEAVGPLHVRGSDGKALPGFPVRYCSERFAPASFEAQVIDMPVAIQASARKRRAEYSCGRPAARFALAALGVAAQVPSGKHREPLWPPGIIGSITPPPHYAAAVAFPAGRVAGVGIDIEPIASGDALAAIEATALCAQENDVLRRSVGPLPMATLISLVFSVKERFFKAAFNEVGRYFDFDAVQHAAVDVAAHRLTLDVRYRLSDRFPAGARMQAYFCFIDDGTLCTSFSWS